MSPHRVDETVVEAIEVAVAPRSPLSRLRFWRGAFSRIRGNHAALFGLVFLVGLSLVSGLGPLLMGALGIEAGAQDLLLGPSPPSLRHPFGTDILGRDMLLRVMMGSRLSLTIGLFATLVSLSIGLVYGAVAGYAGGRTDNFMMRIVDALYALPYLFLVILLMVLVRTLRLQPDFAAGMRWMLHPTFVLFATLGAVQWLTMARIVRGQVLSLKRREFVAAARSVGVSSTGIVFRHLIPNTVGPVIVYATLTAPTVILQEAFLSFLGLGVEPPDTSWGTLVNEGARAMSVYPWLLAFPAIFLATTIFSLNALGDGLRDAFDPHTQRSKQ